MSNEDVNIYDRERTINLCVFDRKCPFFNTIGSYIDCRFCVQLVCISHISVNTHLKSLITYQNKGKYVVTFKQNQIIMRCYS